MYLSGGSAVYFGFWFGGVEECIHLARVECATNIIGVRGVPYAARFVALIAKLT